MGFKEQELCTVEEVAERLKTSLNHVNELLRSKAFNHVVITKRSSDGNPTGDWTAHYYFDESVWPYRKDKTARKHSSAGNLAPVWASRNEVHCPMFQEEEREEDYLDDLIGPHGWLDDAKAIFIPRLAIERLEEIRSLSTVPDHSSPWKTLPVLLKAIRSKRLKAALSAYHELYVLNKIDERRGHSEQVKIWVKANCAEMSTNERSAIAAVVNIDPRRGKK